ncbi:hypothetical protein CN918_25555 [Priestia megaterium]|nr:hypothetical protein CN918_25555 [Priestia megaterium]
MKRVSKLAVVGILSIALLAACSSKNETSNSTLHTSKKLTKPAVHVMVNDKQIKVKTATYSIHRGDKAEEAEKGPVETIAKSIQGETVEPGSLVQLYFDEKDKLDKAYVRVWDNQTGKAIQTKNNQFTAPMKEGEYTYEVLAYFPNGDVQYIFKLDVQADHTAGNNS